LLRELRKGCLHRAEQTQARARQNTPELIWQKPRLTGTLPNIGSVPQSVKQFGPQLAKLSVDLPLKHVSHPNDFSNF